MQVACPPQKLQAVLQAAWVHRSPADGDADMLLWWYSQSAQAI